MKVHMPSTVDEVCRILAEHDPAPIPIAGATDLFVHWPTRLEEHDKSYVDLSRVRELHGLTITNEWITFGALTTYYDVVIHESLAREYPALIAAARQVGAIQIQARGTWVGNIVNASPAADGVPAFMAYDAVVELTSCNSSRAIPLSEFYLGYKKMQRRPDELVTAVRIPRRTYDVQVFEKVGARRAQAITKVGAAITRSANGNRDAWRVVANSVAPTVRRCRAIEKLLSDRVSIREPSEFLDVIDADVSPIDDIRSTAQYRRNVLANVLYHSLRDHCEWIT